LPSPNAHAFPQGDGVGIRLIPEKNWDRCATKRFSLYDEGGGCVEIVAKTAKTSKNASTLDTILRKLPIVLLTKRFRRGVLLYAPTIFCPTYGNLIESKLHLILET